MFRIIVSQIIAVFSWWHFLRAFFRKSNIFCFFLIQYRFISVLFCFSTAIRRFRAFYSWRSEERVVQENIWIDSVTVLEDHTNVEKILCDNAIDVRKVIERYKIFCSYAIVCEFWILFNVRTQLTINNCVQVETNID